MLLLFLAGASSAAADVDHTKIMGGDPVLYRHSEVGIWGGDGVHRYEGPSEVRLYGDGIRRYEGPSEVRRYR